MGLVLRKNLTEPLTHSQLDGNFEFLQISEWSVQIYEKGKVIYIIDPVLDTTSVYICVRTHNTMLYINNEFRTVDNEGNRYWSPLTNGDSGTVVKSVILLEDKITLRVIHQDDTYIDFSLSETYSNGLTSHQFLKITTNDFGISGNTITLDYTGTLAMTDNIIVVDLSDITYTENYYIVLPNGDENMAGARVKILLKNFEISDPDKKFYIKANNVSNKNRIMGRNLETYVSGSGYFLPLNIMEIADLIWDGNDWLVTNYIKEEYVSALALPPVL